MLDAVGQEAPIGECLFHAMSVGSVTGLRLADGNELVVKAYQRRWSVAFLRAVLDTQVALHDNSIPCARPLGGPVRCGPGLDFDATTKGAEWTDELAPDLDEINDGLDYYPSPLNRAVRSAAIAAAPDPDSARKQRPTIRRSQPTSEPRPRR